MQSVFVTVCNKTDLLDELNALYIQNYYGNLIAYTNYKQKHGRCLTIQIDDIDKKTMCK